MRLDSTVPKNRLPPWKKHTSVNDKWILRDQGNKSQWKLNNDQKDESSLHKEAYLTVPTVISYKKARISLRIDP